MDILWDWVEDYYGNFARAKCDAGYGLIDRVGKLLGSCLWENVWEMSGRNWRGYYSEFAVDRFDEGYTIVKKDGKWGIIDTNGILVVPCRWDFISRFRKGILTVRDKGEEFQVDIHGNRV